MNVHSSARRKAVLGIYGAHRKPRGGSFSLRQLEAEWKQIGLRRFDLRLALKDLVQRQWLHLTHADDQPQYELTYLGECAVHMALADGALALINDWVTLRHAKSRAQHQTADANGPRNRRAGDRKTKNDESSAAETLLLEDRYAPQR